MTANDLAKLSEDVLKDLKSQVDLLSKEDRANPDLCPYHCKENNYQIFIDTWKPCPLHGHLTNIGEKLSMQNESNLYNLLGIPAYYHNKPLLSGEDFIHSLNRNDLQEMSAKKFSAVLSELIQNINGNGKELRSYLFCVDEGVDFCNYIYPYLLNCAIAKKNVTPYVSLINLCTKANAAATTSFNVSDIEMHEYLTSLYKNFSMKNPYPYTSYLSADVVFIRLPSALTKAHINVLADILEERSMYGLPTYVVGTLNHYMSLTYNSSDVFNLKNLTATRQAELNDYRLSRLTILPLLFNKKSKAVENETDTDVTVNESDKTSCKKKPAKKDTLSDYKAEDPFKSLYDLMK